MSSDIPQELYPEILIRLPVKSLLRFKCVSKSWNSLISSPEFITMHINHNNANNNNNALLRMYYTDSRVAKYTLHLENENLDKIMEIEFPENYFQEFFYIVGCVNGLVCLADSYQIINTVLLWNPLIRKFLTLPTPSNELSCQELMETSMGFGFDIQGKDYKFVRIYKINGRLSMDLFKLSTSNWIDVDVPSSLPCLDWIATYFNGVLHWFANSDNLIVGFDLGLETFTKIMLPRELKRTSSNSVWDGILIAVWRGFLALVERENGYRYSLWVMKEYGVSESWTKQFVVEGFGRLNNVRRNGELMFYDRDFSYLDSYDSETQSTKHNILGLEEELNMLQMTPYIESLVLVNEGTSYLLDQ